MARRQVGRSRARTGDRRHRQCDRPQPARDAAAPGRLAQRDAAAWRLARRRARRDLRAGSGARLGRRPGAGRAWGRAGRLGRRGRALRQHARQPIVYRRARRGGDRRRRPAATARSCAPRSARPAMPAGRANSSTRTATSGFSRRISSRAARWKDRGLRIGVVEAIIGNWNYWVTVTGEQNHAGTTEMRRRKDAAAALVRLASRIHDRFAEIAGEPSRTVWTIGRILVDPNAPSIVPGPGRDAGAVPRHRHRHPGAFRAGIARAGRRGRARRAMPRSRSRRSRRASRPRWTRAFSA